MRTLVISDVHANLTALNAVLEGAGTFDQVWCLGDLVGYGPDPNECIERIAALPGLQCVKGNHDAAILGEISTRVFNNEARVSLSWLESVLSWANKRWLSALDERVVIDNFTLVHGSPRNPVWEYIMGVDTARANMSQFTTQVCLVGHTHLPVVYQMEGDSMETTRQVNMVEVLPFALEQRLIINPGSVGQPRDNDPRAAYAIYDHAEGTITYHRVAYNVQEVQARILAAGLPDQHAHRLALGW